MRKTKHFSFASVLGAVLPILHHLECGLQAPEDYPFPVIREIIEWEETLKAFWSNPQTIPDNYLIFFLKTSIDGAPMIPRTGLFHYLIALMVRICLCKISI